MQLDVVTFNMRIDGDERFKSRLALIAEKIHEAEPDIICMQEMSHRMQLAFIDVLDQYFVVGGGRDDSRLGESVPIAFNKRRFILSNCRTLWLSPTPNIPGSRYTEDQSGCPRVYTLITLTDIDSQKSVRIYNTHLDHIGHKARLDGITQLLADMKKDNESLPYPVILTGDFNADPTMPEIRTVTDSGWLRDITGQYTQTFNNFGKPFKSWDGNKIDYIFVSDEIECKRTELWDDRRNGEYLSDHYVIMANLEF